MSLFKEFIENLREHPNKIKTIYNYVVTDPVVLSLLPDDTYALNDGNHRANLLNLLYVNNIPSIVDGKFEKVPVSLLRRPNGSIGTQGYSPENMIKLANYILKEKHPIFEELIEDKEEDEKIVKSFKTRNLLSKDIFESDGDEFLVHTDVRKKLLQIADKFMDSLDIDFFIHDIILTGSLANYGWSEYSDIDLHILIDFKETDYDVKLVKEFFDAKKDMWNNTHNIKIKNYDVEIYVQDVDEKHVSSGVYSILHNKWLIEPERTNPNIDDSLILKKGEEFVKQIDKLESDLDDGKDVYEGLRKVKHKIKKLRQSGLERGGEYSYENLTFKLLRRNGYIKKLMDLKNRTIDKKLSIQ
jgi:hypothetical protein